MKKLMILTGCLLLAAMLMSCAVYPVPITATGNEVSHNNKVGKSSGTIYFGMLGDASDANIYDAAKNGNITKISTVDVEVQNFLGIVQNVTCVVTGQ